MGGEAMIVSTSSKHTAPALRPYLPKDVPMLQRIARASIERLAVDEYSSSQIEAWMDVFEDAERLASRLQSGLTLIATVDGLPAGFALLKGNSVIDLLYVAPGVVRRGVATTLIDALEKLAAARGAATMTVDASDVARDFFLQRGYEPQSRNTVPIGDEWLGNTSMMKPLSAKADPLQ
jgi:putative acetyltransferase